MENKHNNVGLIITIVILVIIIIALVFGFGAYVLINNVKNELGKQQNVQIQEDNKEEQKNNPKEEQEDEIEEKEEQPKEQEDKKEEVTETNKENNVDSSNARAATLENPLKLGEWGLASKYVSKYLSSKYENQNYVDVPTRGTKVTRGTEAEKMVKEWFNNQRFYKYEDPKANTEWVVFDYQVDLNGLTFDEGTIGTSIDIRSDVDGLNGGSVKYNDITYILLTHDITDSEYVKNPGVYEGRFIVTLPIGCTDYLVKLGDSYNGAESYFKCE